MKKTKTFWAKVVFNDFCAHYLGMTAEQRAKDVEESIMALLTHNSESECFGSKMIRWSQERIEARSEINRANVNSRWNGANKPSMPTIEQLYNFCNDSALDPVWAREWYEMTEERGGKTRDGKDIMDWKKAVAAYVKAREKTLKGHQQ